jgi:hypothetical protein
MKDLRKIQEFFSKPIEDKIDTITMDVPLFLRTLEYAREDAKDDMDLHDVTEKAIKGTKEKGVLTMKDYNNLTEEKISSLVKEILSEQKRDRCLRIADRKFDKPSAYKSGAVVRCRKGKIWKKLKEIGDAGSKIYPYSKVKELYWKTEYEFTTDLGTEYIVRFDREDESADVVFFTKESRELARRGEISTVFLSSANKGEMFSVMATITQIVKEFLDENKTITTLGISPSKKSPEDDRRWKLYMAYINKQLDPSKFEVDSTSSKNNITITRKNITSENLDPTSFKDDNKSSPYGSGYIKIKEDISSKIKTYRIPYNQFNIEIKGRIKEWKDEYGNDTALINEMVARNLLYKIAQDLFGGVEEIDFVNKAKNPTNHFQMVMYLGNMILWTSPFIYVDNNHKVIANKTEIKVLDEDYEDLAVLKEDESLHKWFKRQGPSGKEGGWVDCNTCRTTDGKTKCKACGRKKGEKRSKYPSCRPTPAKCKDKGKGKTWGKTK